MRSCFLVVDNEWNQTNCKALIGKYFAVAPSYCLVKPAFAAPNQVYENMQAYRDSLS